MIYLILDTRKLAVFQAAVLPAKSSLADEKKNDLLLTRPFRRVIAAIRSGDEGFDLAPILHRWH